MSDLKPCACGKTPADLCITEGSTFRWRYISGSCCGEWEHECRVPTIGDKATPEGVRQACIDAWNELPRNTSLEQQLTAANAQIKELKKNLAAYKTAEEVWCRQDDKRATEIAQLTAANARVEALNANAIVRRIGDIDYENGDSLCLKFGGDGDNGEYLIELMEQAIESLLEQEKGDE